MLPIDPQAVSSGGNSDGNSQVVKMLEDWLVQAKRGQMNYIVLVSSEGPGQIRHGMTGSVGSEFGINWGLDTIKRKIYDGMQMRHCPQDVNSPADRACFNMMQMAPSYDFMNWLAIAVMEMKKAGLPGPLRVGFWKGRVAETWKDDDRRPGMFENVVRPALKFVGAIEDETAVTGRAYTAFLLRSVTEAMRDGAEVPTFRASDQARVAVAKTLYGRPVVITLREANHWPHRNSNLDEWLTFARYLQRSGEDVIFVRDTAKADETIPGYEFDISPKASRDIDYRLALYEASKCSLFAANGPWNLAVFSEFPWLMFNEALPNDPFEFNRPEGWKLHNGIGPGEQLPWSRPDQRIIWKQDTYVNMRQAWDEYAPLLQRKEAA